MVLTAAHLGQPLLLKASHPSFPVFAPQVPSLTVCLAFQILVQVKEVLSKLSTLVETTLKEVRVVG